MNYIQYKEEVLKYAQQMAEMGYLVASGGNVSVRIQGEEALAITPSGKDYLKTTVNEIAVRGFDGTIIEGDLKPSIEMGMHTAVYQNRPDVNAIIHTHQPFATIFALINHPIPALFDEQVVYIGDRVEIVPYALSGSPELAANLASKLGNQCNAYILQNHGIICMGTTMEKTAVNIQVLEKTARIYHAALTSGLPITPLSPEGTQFFFDILKQSQKD